MKRASLRQPPARVGHHFKHSGAMAEQESRYPTFEPPYDVAKFPLWSLAKYLQRMRQLDVHRQKHERNSATKHLLSYLKRPANLFPLVRLIFPSVRRHFSHEAPGASAHDDGDRCAGLRCCVYMRSWATEPHRL